jgi:hypothetical protein
MSALKPTTLRGKTVARKGKLGAGDCLGKYTESRTMARIGAKATANSGATDGDKGDGVFLSPALAFRLEHKQTIKDSLSVKHEWLLKISHEANSLNQVPALQLLFTDKSGVVRREGAWVAIPEADFLRLTGGAQ